MKIFFEETNLSKNGLLVFGKMQNILTQYSLFLSLSSSQMSSSLKDICAIILNIWRTGAVFEAQFSTSFLLSSTISNVNKNCAGIAFSVMFDSSTTRKIRFRIFANSLGYEFLHSWTVHVKWDFCVASLRDQFWNVIFTRQGNWQWF